MIQIYLEVPLPLGDDTVIMTFEEIIYFVSLQLPTHLADQQMSIAN